MTAALYTMAASALSHLVAVSLLERTGDGEDITDSIARDCTRRSTGQLASKFAALGTGGINGYQGLAVWRVSSVGDLMRRISRLPDGSLSKVDIVGHGKPGHLFIGVGNAKEREGDPNSCISVASAAGIAALRHKLAAGTAGGNTSMFERVPRLRLVGCDVGSGDEGRTLIAAVSELLGGVVVMATTEKLGSYCPLMEVEEAA
jgi:hypothetical protein